MTRKMMEISKSQIQKFQDAFNISQILISNIPKSYRRAFLLTINLWSCFFAFNLSFRLKSIKGEKEENLRRKTKSRCLFTRFWISMFFLSLLHLTSQDDYERKDYVL